MNLRIAAIVPAAGHSRRMGQPKLLMKLGEQTVISLVIDTLRAAGIERVLVVIRPDDTALADEVARTSAELIQPQIPPSDMRQSVEVALQVLLQEGSPCDGWLLVPADHPALDAESVRQLVTGWEEHSTAITVPTWNGRRGHPTLFPMSLAQEVLQLPADTGLNQLLRRCPERVREVPAASSEVLRDLDTPADWEELLRRTDADRQDLPNSDVDTEL